MDDLFHRRMMPWWLFHRRHPHASNCIAAGSCVSAWTWGHFVFLFLQADVYYTS
jgi:hypothetical protein